MKTRLLLVSLLLATSAFAADTFAPAPTAAATPPALSSSNGAKSKHFLILLRLPERLHDQKAWTKEDNAAVGAHFQRLKAAVAEGKVLLAGRTEEPLDRTMGLIVLTAPDEAAAREFVAAGVMTATLHPYGLALIAR